MKMILAHSFTCSTQKFAAFSESPGSSTGTRVHTWAGSPTLGTINQFTIYEKKIHNIKNSKSKCV